MSLVLEIAAGIVLAAFVVYGVLVVAATVPDLWETHVYKKDWRRRTGHNPW